MTSLDTRLEQKLGWIILALVLGGCLLVLLPFVSALLWAVVLCFSTWPLYRRLVSLVGGRGALRGGDADDAGDVLRDPASVCRCRIDLERQR